ncbi:hypothetical protein YC2023_111659 [Brassica napus]
MLTKFETSSNQVRGLSFHPKRPWILSSLHTGVIQLWDYRMTTLIDTFEEHEGPVRGVHFHISQPLFVSGGDDYKIKVWNYKTHKCLFTLLGHLDYIRTVQFHHECPWIVSASDDQTIRIWNWQSRTCVSVLAGHNHYVMCASFHPKEDLLVSASLDQTVRVWDIAPLRNKKKTPLADDDDIMGFTQMNSDLFDATVKYVLEGHDRGVNWAAFHPTLPLIVSGADDRKVKLWRTNETKAWEVDTLRGHSSNVSSVMFHAKHDVIVSNSEDKTIRVWDATKRTEIKTFRRENDRFWILAAHPETNLLAAGHDSGLIVFKLERERPAFALSGDSLLYAKDGFLRRYEYSTQKDSQVIPIQRPRTVSHSPTENAALISSDLDGGSYELYIIRSGVVQRDAKRVSGGGSAVFIARNRFAVLDKSTGQEEVLVVKNLKNEVVKKIPLPIPTYAIFYAGTGTLLCRCEGKVVMFDLTQRLVLGEVHTPSVRHVVWSNDMESVALLSKHTIILASKKELVIQCTLHETTTRVKSGAWDDDNGVFIYTTLNHVKYCLPNGDSGVIRTLDEITVNATEYMFKLALMRKRFDHVARMIKSSRISGQAMVAYLQQKGFPEVALHFVEEEGHERVRFNLAIESGNMSVAVASATKINEKDYWFRLGVEALRQGGNSSIVEFAYQQTRSIERLSFLYLITGNLEKLSKLMKKKDVMGQFQNALYLGDVKERVKILEKGGLLPLAYITASVHGLKDIAERLSIALGDDVPSLPQGKTHSLLMPPIPVVCGGDWPLLRVMKGIFEGGLESGNDDVEEGDWGDALDMVDVEEDGEGSGWGGLELLDTPFMTPSQGMDVSQIWSQESPLAAEQAAAGSFDTAMSLLHRQLGIKNFAPLKSMLLDLFSGSHSYLPAFSSSPVLTSLTANLQPPHLRLALLSAMGVCYKARNLATAYNFAKRLLETNPTESQAKTARQIVQAAERNMTDATELNYDFRNPFVICGSTYVPIYRGQENVSCPYCTARFVPSQEGNICGICDLAVIGADASGLLCSPSQVRHGFTLFSFHYDINSLEVRRCLLVPEVWLVYPVPLKQCG